MDQRKPIIGIDLGTTYSVVAYVSRAGQVTCLPDRDGEVLTPSCVLIERDGSAIVGREARQALTQAPARTVEGFKRHMGDGTWQWTVNNQSFTPQDLSATVLRRLAEDAQRIIGPIAGAVITVPAYFGDRQRTATLEAAVLADLDVVALINEPTAAALADAFESYIAAGGDGADLTKAAIASTAPGVNVICDLGGGTFDVTAIRISGHDFDIMASGGTRLGGRDFDDQIIEAMVRHLFDHNGPDPFHDPLAQARMRIAAEQAKHTLTVKSQAIMPAPYDRVPPLAITRQKFEQSSQHLLDRARKVIESVMADAKLEWAGVESLLLVGGASRIPMFRKMTTELSGKTPQARLQPDLVVAQGAGIYGAILQVQERGGTLPVGIPLSAERKDDDGSYAVCEIDGGPPTADAAGASSEGPLSGRNSLLDQGALAGEGSTLDAGFAAAAWSVQVRDVTSQSLGAVVWSPRRSCTINAVVIPRNSRLPALRSRVFATHEPNQQRVCIPIVEGDDLDPDRCTQIGECVIDPLPPGLAQGSRVEVTFSYDTSGRVNVRAQELATGTSAQTVLERYVPREPSRTQEPNPIQGPSRLEQLAYALNQRAPS